MAVEVLKQQLADLTRDYTGACEAIRQLEANVAEARAEVERTNHIMRLERMARQDSEDRLKAQLTAAEAAREAVLASLAAAAARAAVVCEALALFGRLCAVGRAEVPLIEERAEMVRACAQGRPA